MSIEGDLIRSITSSLPAKMDSGGLAVMFGEQLRRSMAWALVNDDPAVRALLDVAEAAGGVLDSDFPKLTHDEAVARADALADALDRLREVSP